jgi:MFS family permease
VTTSPQTTIEQPIAAGNGHVRDAALPALPTEADDGPFSPSKITLTLGLILTIGGVAFETLAVATILPAVVEDLGGLHLYGWAFSAFLLAQLVGIVVAGLLADARGPALPFAVGVLLFAAGLLVGGLAPTMLVLILGRALQGLGGGAIGSIAYVGVGRGYSENAKPKMLALLSTAWVVPGLVGPGLAGIMAEGLGWRSVFLLLAPLPILSGLLAFPSLRRMGAGTPSPEARVRTVSALALAIGAGMFLTGIAQPDLRLALALAAAGLTLTVPALRRLLPDGTLRARTGMPAAVATMGLINLAFFGVDAFVPLALVDVRGTSIAFAGLALTATTIMWTAGSWVQARTASRVSRRVMARVGLVILVATFLATAVLLFPQVPVTVAPVIWGIAGLGMGLGYTTLSLTMLELAEPGQEGDVSASIQLASVLGSGFGAGIGGAFIALLQTRGETVGQALLIQFVLMTAVTVLAFVAARGLPNRAAPTAAVA